MGDCCGFNFFSRLAHLNPWQTNKHLTWIDISVGRKLATSSIRFYCTKRDDHENYIGDPWTKYREDHPPSLISSLLPIQPPAQQQPVLTHVNQDGQARMVDVSEKEWTLRRAVAQAHVWIGEEAFRLVAENQIKKGDVLKVAEIAGISGGKLTSQLIPLCHPIALHQLSLRLSLEPKTHCIIIESEAVTRGPTGVEMEALTAVSVAGLTIIDMVKAVTKEAEIRNIHLFSKSGGTRGDFVRA